MKIRQTVRRFLADDSLFFGTLLICVAVAAFGLGRLSVLDADSADRNVGVAIHNAATSTSTDVRFVGSVNSDKYHLPWCSGAKRIDEANKQWFDSVSEAQAAGYEPAGNCEGISSYE